MFKAVGVSIFLGVGFMKGYTHNLPWPIYMQNPARTGIFYGTSADSISSPYIKWSVPIPVQSATPVLGDIDGDSAIEVVIGAADGSVYALRGTDGSTKWTSLLGDSIYSASPALGDIDGDNEIEVVIGANDGNVYSLKGSDGTIEWTRNVGDRVYSSPALGDINGDSIPEIFIAVRHQIVALEGVNGNIVWSALTGNLSVAPAYSSPAIDDIDGDSTIEVVVGANNGTLYALDGATGNIEWTNSINVITIYPSHMFCPAIGDIDNDSITEIVVHPATEIYSFSGLNGTPEWIANYGTVLGTTINIGVSLCDINNDGSLEVLSTGYKIQALDPYTGSLIWENWLPGDTRTPPAPVLVDLDNDGKFELITGNHAGEVGCLETEDGSIKWVIQVGNNIDIHPTHAIGDIDGDGCLEIVGAGLGAGGYEKVVYAIEDECPSASIEEKQSIPTNIEKTSLQFIDDKLCLRLLESSWVELEVYNIVGQLVMTPIKGYLPAGTHEFETSIKPGIYFAKVHGSKGKTESLKFIKLK